MVSLLILKVLYNLSDEQLVLERWEMNAYFQYFSGEQHQRWGAPCAPSDLVYFTKRIGKKGAEKILKHSIEKHGKHSQEPHVSVDTTVQEKNITYPTDAKQYKKIIDKAVKIAQTNKISLRRSYKRTAKQLLRATHNSTHPRRRVKAQAARGKLKTIAGRLVRELERHLPAEVAKQELTLFKKVLAQGKYSKEKCYSLHEPQVYCMSKGKAHKRYEYGCKASLVVTQNSGIIVGAMTFARNRYDGHTLEEALAQSQQLTGRRAKSATVDRGYKGTGSLLGTQINSPKPASSKDTAYQRRRKRRHFSRRAAIEAVIGHLKSDHRAGRNYLKGALGDSVNFIMAAAGFNFKKLMKKLKGELFWHFTQLCYPMRLGFERYFLLLEQ